MTTQDNHVAALREALEIADALRDGINASHDWTEETERAEKFLRALSQPPAPEQASGETVARYFDLTLTKDEAEYIVAFIADENEPDDEVVRLMTGPGHSGYGLYAFHPDYLDEGAVLVKSLPTPEPMKAADEFELRRLLAEEQYTVRQLNRALREATEAPTFMGEPVATPTAKPAAPVAAKPEQQAQAGEPEVWGVWLDGEPPHPQPQAPSWSGDPSTQDYASTQANEVLGRKEGGV